MLSAEVHDGIEKLDADSWRALAPQDDPTWEWGFLRTVERGGIGPARFHYVVVRENDRVVGIQPAFELPAYALEETGDARTRRYVSLVRRVAPGFMRVGTLFCGHPVGEGRCLTAPGTDSREVYQTVVDAAWRLARERGLRLIVFKDVTSAEHDRILATPSGRARFFGAPGLPDAVIEMKFSDFDGYLAGLKSAARRNVRSKMRKFLASGLRIDVRDRFDDLVPRLQALYDEVYARAEVRLEHLTPEFFRALSERSETRLICCWNGDTLVAFALLLFAGGRCVNFRLGMNYQETVEHRVYFMLHYETIKVALERGCREVSLCQTTYPPKLEMGCVLRPYRNVVSHLNPLFRSALRFTLPRSLQDYTASGDSSEASSRS